MISSAQTLVPVASTSVVRKEFPGEAVKRLRCGIATAILMYFFGGLRREGGGESEMLPNLQRLSVVRPVACAPNSRKSLMTLGRCAITLRTRHRLVCFAP